MKESYAIHVLKRELKKAESHRKMVMDFMDKSLWPSAVANKHLSKSSLQIHDLKSGIKKLEGK